MQDKSYVVAVIVVLAICCLGMYVAVSGYLNANPPAPGAVTITFNLLATPVAVNLPTDTPASVQPTLPRAPTVAPIPSPLGAFQTAPATPAGASQPTAAPKPATLPPTQAAIPGVPSCGNLPFCPKAGPPDANLGPTGNECPRNYIWGLITDASGKGLPNIRIRHKAPNGDIGETVSKDKPDVPGKYDVLAPSGTFVIWIVGASGAPASPQVSILVQPYSGVGNCPMRVDFVQQP